MYVYMHIYVHMCVRVCVHFFRSHVRQFNYDEAVSTQLGESKYSYRTVDACQEAARQGRTTSRISEREVQFRLKGLLDCSDQMCMFSFFSLFSLGFSSVCRA